MVRPRCPVETAASSLTSLAGPIIAEWHDAHPNVKLDLVIGETPDLLAGLHDETLDLIVADDRDLPDQTDDLDLTLLPPQTGWAFCRAGHPILNTLRPKATDLARYKFAGSHFPEAVVHALAQKVGRDTWPSEPIVAIDSHNIVVLRDAAIESDLILLTTPGAVRKAPALGVIKRIPVELRIHGIWHIVGKCGRMQHPAMPRLADKIVEIRTREFDRRLSPSWPIASINSIKNSSNNRQRRLGAQSELSVPSEPHGRALRGNNCSSSCS